MSSLKDLNDATSAGNVGVSPDAFPVTPADGTDLSRPIRAIRANVGGVVRCYTAISYKEDGTIKSAPVARDINIASGETRYIAIGRVLATGTTATGLEGMP